jgi:16S rRNA (guanine966-N2)-methyltransferase
MNSSKRPGAKGAAPHARPRGAAPPGVVRIIAGEHRGRRLHVLVHPDLRPTPDRVRETLFNWLGQRLDGLSCLDLYAGTGALGFEAASRGAARVVMVERDRAAYAELVRSKALLREERAELLFGDAIAYLKRSTDVFDVVFLDPPFRQNALPEVLALVEPRLAPGARIYLEGPAPYEPQPGASQAFVELRRSRAGQVSYQLLQWTGDGTP